MNEKKGEKDICWWKVHETSVLYTGKSLTETEKKTGVTFGWYTTGGNLLPAFLMHVDVDIGRMLLTY